MSYSDLNVVGHYPSWGRELFFSDLLWSRFVSRTINLMLPTSIVFCLQPFSVSSRMTPLPQCRQSSVFFCILSVFYPLAFHPKLIAAASSLMNKFHLLGLCFNFLIFNSQSTSYFTFHRPQKDASLSQACLHLESNHGPLHEHARIQRELTSQLRKPNRTLNCQLCINMLF